MREYWQGHSTVRANVDHRHDPDGLGNVCHPGAPLWLNQYYARYQEQVFRQLFLLLPEPAGRPKALDVGCGTGRWSRFLTDRGYETVGIDLQAELIERNRYRHPDIEFEPVSVQDFATREPFDLLCSVTVIQHVPFEDQMTVIDRMRQLTRTGGHVLALENVSDQAPHVFANPVPLWIANFEAAGFATVAVQPYDYSPFLRSVHVVKGLSKFLARRRSSTAEEIAPATFMIPGENAGSTRSGVTHGLQWAVTRCAVALDGLVEPFCIQRKLALPTIHCGFLFRAI